MSLKTIRRLTSIGGSLASQKTFHRNKVCHGLQMKTKIKLILIKLKYSLDKFPSKANYWKRFIFSIFIFVLNHRLCIH